MTTSPPLPELRPAGPRCIAELADRLGESRITIDPATRLHASRDHAWLSPVLTSALPDVTADVVVAPRGEQELAAVLAVAFEHGVAVTCRGRGTGNYGQAVPLAGGIVLDTVGLGGVVGIGQGWLHACAGTSFLRLEEAARETGQELAMFPSTTSSALGGFLAGGAGGTGSIENGWVWDGFVGALEVLPCWDRPEPVQLGAAGSEPHLHAYGTTGVIVAAEVALRPARHWVAVSAEVPRFDEAAAMGRRLLALEPKPRNLSVDDDTLAGLLGAPHVRAIVEESTVPEALRITGGSVDAGGPARHVSLSFNHVTLRAKRADPAMCHVQVAGDVLADRPDAVRESLPGAMLHLDGNHLGFGGLLLSRFVGEPTLYAGMDALRDLGVRVVDPHTWEVGGHGDLTATRAAARAYDPLGLLNPGKLAR